MLQRSIVSSAERGAASLTTERLDPLRLTMLAIANERMHVSVGDPEVRALLIGTGEALRVHALGCSPPAFHLTPGTHGSRRWPCTRRGREGETTGGAIVWAAGLEAPVERGAYPGSGSRLGRTMMGPAKETQLRERVQEDTQEQKNEHAMRHTDPHEVKFEGWEA